MYYNIKLTQKNYSRVWLPPTTSSLEMERYILEGVDKSGNK